PGEGSEDARKLASVRGNREWEEKRAAEARAEFERRRVEYEAALEAGRQVAARRVRGQRDEAKRQAEAHDGRAGELHGEARELRARVGKGEAGALQAAKSAFDREQTQETARQLGKLEAVLWELAPQLAAARVR